MPLTAEQKAALQALFTGESAALSDATPEDVADGLREVHPTTYNLVLNEGRAKATGLDDKALKKLTKQLAQAETERDELQRQLSSGAPPEVKKQIEDAQAEIQRLQKQIKERDEAAIRERRERNEAEVLDRLSKAFEDTGIRSGWAKMLKHDPDLRNRLKVEVDEDGQRTVTVYQAGKRVPMAASDDTEDAMLAALAQEQYTRLKKEEPEAIKAPPVDTGAGVHNGSGGGEQDYDPAAEGKAMAETVVKARERNNGLAFR